MAEKPASSHFVLITTTRSLKKSNETTAALREYLRRAAAKAHTSRKTEAASTEDNIRRVHLLSVQLDLCNLPTVYKAADQLVNGTVGSLHDGDGELGSVADVQIPRLDTVICNAGIGGWVGLDWPGIAKNLFSAGYQQATTFPTFKIGEPGQVVDPLSGKVSILDPQQALDEDRVMGRVFCSNVFGHYLLAHELLPLLSRPQGSPLPPGRIVWESSVEACSWQCLSLDDFQAVRSHAAYESSKRLCDILSLTANLPGVQAYCAPFFERQPAGGKAKAASASSSTAAIPPHFYLTHPGVVCTPIFPLPAFLFYLYLLSMYVSRWTGSPWHPVSPYNGACAPAWVTLQPQSALNVVGARYAKWGSCVTFWGRSVVKKTEVDGWGWDGRIGSDHDRNDQEAGDFGILSRTVGRKAGAVDLTAERMAEFEALGAECWREMERLRAKWEGILRAAPGEDAPTANGGGRRSARVAAKK